MKRVLIGVSVALLLSCTVHFALAGGGIGGGATEVTQLANNVQLGKQVQEAIKTVNNQVTQITHQITQITNQITMIQDMIHNTLNLPNQLFSPVADIYNKVKGVMNQTQGVVYTLQNYDQELKNRFKSYSNLNTYLQGSGSFSNELKEINYAQRETVRTVLEAIGVTGKEIENDADVLKKLQQHASSAEGRNQILNAANELMAFQAQELIRLRQMVVMFSQMVGTTMEAEKAQEDVSAIRWERAAKNVNDTSITGWTLNEFDY